jgi:hypothetical protein
MKPKTPTCADCRHTVPLSFGNYVVCMIYLDYCRSDSPATCCNFQRRREAAKTSTKL